MVDDDDDDLNDGGYTNVCVACGTKSPKTNTNYTLISSRYGWRLSRRTDEKTGRIVNEWRCPQCWEAFKKRSGTTTQGAAVKTDPGAPVDLVRGRVSRG